MYVFKSSDWVVVFADAGKKKGRLGDKNYWHITIIFVDAIADCSQVMGVPCENYAAALVECYRKNKAAQ
jgi:hypothetical protein